MMNVKILRVLGIRSSKPEVLAGVDDHWVQWSPGQGWRCDCLTEADDLTCSHVTVMADLLDPRVVGDQR